MTTIEQNGSLKEVKKNLDQRRQKITNILDNNEQNITDQDNILQGIEEFCEQLYDSNIQTEESEKSNEPIPNVKDSKMKHAVSHIARGKPPGPGNILTDTIKD